MDWVLEKVQVAGLICIEHSHTHRDRPALVQGSLHNLYHSRNLLRDLDKLHSQNNKVTPPINHIFALWDYQPVFVHTYCQHYKAYKHPHILIFVLRSYQDI